MSMNTKTEQTEQYLRRAIRSGRWSPGDALPSERDLLVELGVSRTTLRNAMYSLAKDGMVIRKHGSGTHVARQNSTASIAILDRASKLSSAVGYGHRLILEEAQKRFREAGYRPVLYIGSDGTEDEFVSSINLFDEPILRDILGVLALTDAGPFEERFRQADMTVVSLRQVMPYGKYCVTLDYVRMTQLATDVLRSHGHDDFAVMCVDFTTDPLYDQSRQRNEFLQHLANSAVGFRKDRVVSVKYSQNYEYAYDEFKKWWSSRDRPKAIFFYDDGLFDVASRAILELGIDVPRDLAIITHANSNRCFQFPIQLWRVGFDLARATTRGCDMLNKLVSGEEVESPVIYIPPEIQHGESL